MKRTMTGIAVALLALGGCRSADVESEPASEPVFQPAPPPADASALPAGTIFEVELEQTIDTDRNRVGDRFVATVKEDLIAQNGAVVIPKGARVHGVITGLDDSDDIGDEALVRLNFERISFGGNSYPFTADIVDTDVDTDEDGIEDALEKAAIGAAAGAVLGAVLSGAELDAILKGAALGAGVGTVIHLGTGDVEARLPEGTDMTLRTTRTVSLR